MNEHKSRPSILAFADGAISLTCAGAGAVLIGDNGRILALANRLLPRMTNNEAEYAGLVLLLELAVPYKNALIEVRLDSEVVVYQMIGRFAVNSAALKVWHRRACLLTHSLPGLTFQHIGREENRLADALAAEALAGRRLELSNR